MTTRSWKAVVSIGGSIASSLPTSARRATQELEKLSGAQRIDAREAKRLSSEIKSVSRGSQEFKTALAQQAAVKTRLAERSVRMRELGQRAQTSTGLLGRFSGGLARIGPYGAAAAAGIGLATTAAVGLVSIADKFSGFTRGLSLQSTVLGVGTEQIQRDSAALRTLTGDATQARQQVAELGKVGQTLRLAETGQGTGDYGQIALGAQRAGVALETIKKGRYDTYVDDIRKSLERGVSTDQIVGGLGLVGLSPDQAGLLLTFAKDTEAFARAKENAASVKLITAEDIRRNREWDDTIGDLKQTGSELWREFGTQLVPTLTTVARTLQDWGPVISFTASTLGHLVGVIDGGVRTMQRMALTGEYLASTWGVASAGIRVGWYSVGAAVTGVTDNVLGKLETLAAGFVSVAATVKTASGGVVDFTGTAANALNSIRELRAETQDANAAAEAGLSSARADLRAANSRLATVYQADRALKAGRQPQPAQQPTPTRPELPEQPQPAVSPQAAQPAPVDAPQPAVRPETAQLPVAAPQPAVRPETAQLPVAAPQPAVRPETAQLPVAAPQPAVRPETAVPVPVAARPELPAQAAPVAARPVPALQPQAALRDDASLVATLRELTRALRGAGQPVEQNNTYYIDGSADPTAVLAAAERSATRLVRQLA